MSTYGPQLIVLDARHDLLHLERLVMERAIIDPRITPHTIMTEYILHLLQGLDDPVARERTVQHLGIVEENPTPLQLATQPDAAISACVAAISRAPYEFIANHHPAIHYSQLWYLTNTYLYYMVFSNNLDRQTQVYENDHHIRTHF